MAKRLGTDEGPELGVVTWGYHTEPDGTHETVVKINRINHNVVGGS